MGNKMLGDLNLLFYILNQEQWFRAEEAHQTNRIDFQHFEFGIDVILEYANEDKNIDLSRLLKSVRITRSNFICST